MSDYEYSDEEYEYTYSDQESQSDGGNDESIEGMETDSLDYDHDDRGFEIRKDASGIHGMKSVEGALL